MPKLPNAEGAVVAIDKLVDYSLNKFHEVGKHKARVFKSALNLTVNDAEWLRQILVSVAQTHDVTSSKPSAFGMKYVIDFELTHEGLAAIVRSSWIVDEGTDFPRLTSCYVKRGND